MRASALNLLARREHSKFELRRKLRRYGATDELIEETIALLAECDYQSDVRFTDAYVSSRAARGFGPVRILAELRERGVDCSLRELDQVADWTELCSGARVKKFGILAPTDRSEWQRQARFLHCRGFSESLIRRVLSD